MCKGTLFCAYRFGNCVPFTLGERENICDGFYTPGVDYVYIPYRRQNGIYSELIAVAENAAIIRGGIPDRCLDPAIRVFCHYYLPPCGNTTLFEPPTSVCMEVCNYLRDLCPLEWERVVAFFEESDATFRPEGLTFINCSNTGEYLDPLPYCCSDTGVDIHSAQPSSQRNSGGLAITVGSVCATVAVLLLVVSGTVTWIVIRKYRQRQKLKTAEPPAR